MSKNINFFKALVIREMKEKELSPKQKQIAKLNEPKDQLDAGDFKKLNDKSKVSEGEDHEVASALNRLHKNKPLKTGDITTIKYGKYKGKKVKITADLGNGRYKIDLINKDIKESEDHEVSMAQSSLKEIISNASQLMEKIGQQEKDIPGWIQDHITNAENYINQANKGYYDQSITKDY